MSKSTIDLPSPRRDLSPDTLLTPGQYAAYALTTEAQLAQQRYRGEGPRFVKFGRTVRYRWSDILAYIEASTRQQT